jgi:hypothetical protein
MHSYETMIFFQQCRIHDENQYLLIYLVVFTIRFLIFMKMDAFFSSLRNDGEI